MCGTKQSDFEILEKEIGTVVESEETAPIWKMPKIMGRDFHRLMDYVKSQHSELVDAPYSHYVDIQWEKELNKGMRAKIRMIQIPIELMSKTR